MSNNRVKWTPELTSKLVALRNFGVTLDQIAKDLGVAYSAVVNKLKQVRPLLRAGVTPTVTPEVTPKVTPEVAIEVELPKPEFGRLPLESVDYGGWLRYGLVSDTHLCCKEERLAELHNLYDIFKQEGLTTVFHAGNPIDGYIQRINGESVFSSTIDGQAQYFADNYPQRDGIKTFFITGDDHESWFAPGFNIGAYMQAVAEKEGRTDLQYIGHVESDVEIKTGAASTLLRIQHPGGGSAYARSYSAQKVVESLEGGEKPGILVLGHWHVSNYMQERNIHVVCMPGMQDQTIFARKKRLRMEVGGAILEFKVNPDDGAVTRCRVEFIRYFTRAYYKRYIRSDSKLVGGHLVLNR